MASVVGALNDAGILENDRISRGAEMSERAELERRVLQILESKAFPLTPHDEAEPCVTLADVKAALLSQAQPAHKHTDACWGKIPETEGDGEYLRCGKVSGMGEAQPDPRTANIPDVRKIWEECQGEAQPVADAPTLAPKNWRTEWLVELFHEGKSEGYWTATHKDHGGWRTENAWAARQYTESEAKAVAAALDYFPTPNRWSHWVATEHIFTGYDQYIRRADTQPKEEYERGHLEIDIRDAHAMLDAEGIECSPASNEPRSVPYRLGLLLESVRGEAQPAVDAPSAIAEAIEQCAIEAGERSPEGVSSHTMLGDMWDERILKLRAGASQAPADLVRACEEVMVKIGACYDNGSIDPDDLKILMEFVAKAQPPADGLRPILRQVTTALEGLLALVEGEVPSLLEDDHHWELSKNALEAGNAALAARVPQAATPEWWGRPCEDCKEEKMDCQCLLNLAAKVASMATAEYLRRVEIAAIEKRAQPPADGLRERLVEGMIDATDKWLTQRERERIADAIMPIVLTTRVPQAVPTLSPRQWLISGGNGHEDGEDGLRALKLNGESLVECLEKYREYLLAAAPGAGEGSAPK